MVIFFRGSRQILYAVGSESMPDSEDMKKLQWLFGGAEPLEQKEVKGYFTGPRKEMVTPWSTNAVEITRNMGIEGIFRIEAFQQARNRQASYDPMLQEFYDGIDQSVFTLERKPEPVVEVDDIKAYNRKEGLALSEDEIAYLEDLSVRLGRKLTDSEVFGFSQVNSEHCRHKIFNGRFIIDDREMPDSLFDMIRNTSKSNPGLLVSAYKDNVAFVRGPDAEQFAPENQDRPDFFVTRKIPTVISLKAETHNFPTTVEPFNGAATGSGGEIRDRMAGGRASIPMAGTAVYMTSYPRLESRRDWEQFTRPRKWLYQSPEEILVKASNGASDFGNKFGQPLICGSVLTFEHFTETKKYGYDKVIMLAGGIGFAHEGQSEKGHPSGGDKIVVMGGDNYRIGMGGGAVSSVATGEYDNAIELNAVQRSNPEMQKRVANAIRALAESAENPIISIHDHGAGGHLNSLSELVEEAGGTIDLHKLPLGDPTLSAKEIIGNESQERMGLVLKQKDIDLLRRIADRERAPMYVVGEITGDHRFAFRDDKTGKDPLDLDLADMFGKPPRTVLSDVTLPVTFEKPVYDTGSLTKYIKTLLQMEAVACKDWLTNKVDRSVTGKVAHQQTAGPLQLPLNNLGAVALDYRGEKGIATALGHAPVAGLVDPEKGSVLSIAEALTNIIWAPLEEGLKGISLSANWMWPARNAGENARLYKAVKAAADFAIRLGINIPTGKDSLSMTQKYSDDTVYSPGTVIISAVGSVSNVRKIVSPVLKRVPDSTIIYIDFSGDALSPDGSAFAQMLNRLGGNPPTVKDPDYFALAFGAVQEMISGGYVLAGHDISAGGMITALLEMTFAENAFGLELDLDPLKEDDLIKILFSENPGIVIQVKDTEEVEAFLSSRNVRYHKIGRPALSGFLKIGKNKAESTFDLENLRDIWYKTSFLLDRKQSGELLARERFMNYRKQQLKYIFPAHFSGIAKELNVDATRKSDTGVKAAIIREKGVNGDREMAYSLYLSGFDVKDVHMTDLISGREDLGDVNFIVFVGGFSNSDVLGSAKGWAGAFMFNEKARIALEKFYSRDDTLSLGICNGCQLMMELGLIYPGEDDKPGMAVNDSGKFESQFLNVDILPNDSVMLKTLAGSRLGIWVAHGEGKFILPGGKESKYRIPVKYSYEDYPGNPNGSAYNAAAVCSHNGRHLAMMPHIERAVLPWQWAYYPYERTSDEITPWVEAFVNARNWISEKASP